MLPRNSPSSGLVNSASWCITMGKVAEYPLKHLISFDVVESSSTTVSQMTVEEMISDISNYRKRWDTATKDGTYDQEVVKKVEEQFLVNFIFRSNLEEGHGLRTLDETKSFLGRIFCPRDFSLPLSLEEQQTLNMRNAYENLLARYIVLSYKTFLFQRVWRNLEKWATSLGWPNFEEKFTTMRALKIWKVQLSTY